MGEGLELLELCVDLLTALTFKSAREASIKIMVGPAHYEAVCRELIQKRPAIREMLATAEQVEIDPNWPRSTSARRPTITFVLDASEEPN